MMNNIMLRPHADIITLLAGCTQLINGFYYHHSDYTNSGMKLMCSPAGKGIAVDIQCKVLLNIW